MCKMILVFVFISLTVFPQDSSIVSLENGNKWIYEFNKTLSNDKIISSKTYNIVYKISGDTIIGNKKVKIMEIDSYENYVVTKRYDYWYSNNSIFQMNTGYSTIYLTTYYDDNKTQDSSWNSHGMGGYSSSGSVEIGQLYLYDGTYKTNTRSIDSNYPNGSGRTTTVTLKKYGLYSYNEYSANSPVGMNTNVEMKLIGARMRNEHLGKLDPPEIIDWNLNGKILNIYLRTDSNSDLDKIFIYNVDSLNNKYELVDSSKVFSEHVSKTLKLGNYSIRIMYKDKEGNESAFSNKINFEIAPTEFFVYQNYPNPFNNKTKIGFEVMVGEKVSLDIFNILGQVVYQKERDIDRAGYYEFNVELDKHSSGVYLYRIMQQDKKSIINKMLLLK